MLVALPFLMLVTLVGLGSLAAIVFGIVYAIANKRPGVAVGSVLVPVWGFFAVCLLGMLFIGARQGSIPSPVNITWNDGSAVQGVPGVPPMPAMPRMAPLPPMSELSPLAISDRWPWAMIIVIGLGCLMLFGVLCKGTNCESAPWWRRKKLFVALLVVIAAYFMMSARVRQSAQEVGLKRMEQLRREQESAQQMVVEARQKSADAMEKAAAALVEGKSFQEMFEKLNRPRIQLDAESATMTIGEQKNMADAANKGGATKIVVPMSAETQESLARSVARLERLVEQVSQVADQVTDTGTLLGKAMVALNDRIDSRSKVHAAAPTPSATPQTGLAEVPEPAPIRPAVRVKEVAVTAVTSAPSQLEVEQNAIELGDSDKRTVVVKLDRQLLAQAGLSFEKLKEELSREGMWNGKVVRFDENKLEISATGKFGEDYLSRLKSTFLTAEGLQGNSVHLSDLAEVEAIGLVAEKPREPQARPAWVDEPARKVGYNQRAVLTAGEYATVQDCDRAMDVYLLLATYNRLKQLLGETSVDRRDQPELSFYYLDSDHGADDFVVSGDGQELIVNGQPVDERLQALQAAGITLDFIRREIAQEEYLETVSRSVGPMKRLYTRVEFRPSVDKELVRRWNELKRSERIAVVGAGASSVIALLGLALGLLKVDTWTKGYYSKRLFLGVPAAIIGVLALLAAVAG